MQKNADVQQPCACCGNPRAQWTENNGNGFRIGSRSYCSRTCAQNATGLSTPVFSADAPISTPNRQAEPDMRLELLEGGDEPIPTGSQRSRRLSVGLGSLRYWLRRPAAPKVAATDILVAKSSDQQAPLMGSDATGSGTRNDRESSSLPVETRIWRLLAFAGCFGVAIFAIQNWGVTSYRVLSWQLHGVPRAGLILACVSVGFLVGSVYTGSRRVVRLPLYDVGPPNYRPPGWLR